MAILGGRWSLSKISDELGMDRRTITKRLASVQYQLDEANGGKMYRIQDAMRSIFGSDTATIGSIEDSKARKAYADAIRAEIAMKREQGEVFDLAAFMEVVETEYASVRAKLLGIPDRLAAVLDSTRGIDNKRKVLRKAISEALEELSDDPSIRVHDPAAARRASAEDTPADGVGKEAPVEAAAEANGKRVVGRVPKAKPGSKR